MRLSIEHLMRGVDNHATDAAHLRFCNARRALVLAEIEWIGAGARSKDVREELLGTISLLQQLADLEMS